MKSLKPLLALAATLALAAPTFAEEPTVPTDTGNVEVPAIPAVKPLLDLPMRDTSVTLAPDGYYYLTGTTGAPTWWTTNEGIRLWRSRDLKAWEPLGFVWTFDRDGTWQKRFDSAGRRALWAPEIFHTHGTFWIAYSLNYDTAGTGLLKSTTGKPEGPYEDVKKDGPMTSGIDASLFEDDDGTVYFVWQDGRIAPMKPDMSGLAGPEYILAPSNFVHVGFEAAQVFKAHGRYYVSCAEFNPARPENRYDCMVASSDHLLGPYGPRYIASTTGGHNTFFKDKDGQWWSTYFGNDAAAPFRERAGLLRVHFDPDGKISVVSRDAGPQPMPTPGPATRPTTREVE